MKAKLSLIFMLALVLAGILNGCQSPKGTSGVESTLVQATRNNGYSLLYQLLEEQKDVSLLRFIKHENPELKMLIKKIATASARGAKVLAEFARHDPSIRLNDLRLPLGEVATRAAIAATKQKELLGQSGDEFELSLLLTQTEALSYAWHLAAITAENEVQTERARALAGLSQNMQNLYHEVFAMLRAKAKTPPATMVNQEKL